ncbi:MAG: STAS domain-containing protein [Actinomycetota bacterium]|nr:STAS domain-containing protein [Actinomycetota bacterium]
MSPPDPRFEAPIHEEAAEVVPVPLAPEELLGVTIANGDERGVVIAVSGEVDLHTGGILRRAVDSVLTGHPRLIVLDFSAVDFFSSAGLSTLVDLRRTTDLRGIALRLVCECRAVLRPLTAVGLIELFTRCPTVEVALDQPLDR